MKHGSNSRRSRGGRNGRRSNSRTQVFDSNGPDVRIRGNASQVYEKYVALARDAAAGGDRILAESYLQHAEHYQRVQNEMQAHNKKPQTPVAETEQPNEAGTTEQPEKKQSQRKKQVRKPEMA